jgi:hypothetical protein
MSLSALKGKGQLSDFLGSPIVHPTTEPWARHMRRGRGACSDAAAETVFTDTTEKNHRPNRRQFAKDAPMTQTKAHFVFSKEDSVAPQPNGDSARVRRTPFDGAAGAPTSERPENKPMRKMCQTGSSPMLLEHVEDLTHTWSKRPFHNCPMTRESMGLFLGGQVGASHHPASLAGGESTASVFSGRAGAPSGAMTKELKPFKLQSGEDPRSDWLRRSPKKETSSVAEVVFGKEPKDFGRMHGVQGVAR